MSFYIKVVILIFPKHYDTPGAIRKKLTASPSTMATVLDFHRWRDCAALPSLESLHLWVAVGGSTIVQILYYMFLTSLSHLPLHSHVRMDLNAVMLSGNEAISGDNGQFPVC